VPDMLNFSRGPEGISSSPGASSTAASSSNTIPLPRHEFPQQVRDLCQETNWLHRLLPGESQVSRGGVFVWLERMKEGESSAGGLPSDRPSSLIIIVDIHEKLWEERAAAGYPSITEVMEAIMAFVRAYFMRESSIHHAPPKTSAQNFSPRKVNSATIPDICIASLHPSTHPSLLFFFLAHPPDAASAAPSAVHAGNSVAVICAHPGGADLVYPLPSETESAGGGGAGAKGKKKGGMAASGAGLEMDEFDARLHEAIIALAQKTSTQGWSPPHLLADPTPFTSLLATPPPQTPVLSPNPPFP
jgi:hypothetical protein